MAALHFGHEMCTVAYYLTYQITFLNCNYLNTRKLNPRFTEAEVFDIVKTSTDCVFAIRVGEKLTSPPGKHHKDDIDHVRTGLDPILVLPCGSLKSSPNKSSRIILSNLIL